MGCGNIHVDIDFLYIAFAAGTSFKGLIDDESRDKEYLEPAFIILSEPKRNAGGRP